jgi:ribulokinase
MAANDFFLGLDYGTQSVRCGIVDTMGNFVVSSEEKYDTFFPRPGWAEQRPLDWVNSTNIVIEECFQKVGPEVFGRIRGLSVDTTGSTVIAVDENDEPIGNAILWMDVRAVEQARRVNETEHDVLKYCGKEVSPEWILPKMMWIRDNQPDTFKKTKLIVEFQDYVNHFLTGRWCASISQSTGKCNYVEELGGFRNEFFHEIGFDEFFDIANLDILKQTEPIGSLRSVLAERFHLSPDIQVYQGGLDAYINVIGLGVCDVGDAGIVMGSSFVHIAVVDKPVLIDGLWGPFENVLIPDRYCLEGGQISAASITKWFINEFGIVDKNPYEVMAKEAADVPIGSDGLIALDFFQGNRTPYKNPLAKGVFFGLTLSHKRAHIYRSILESVAFGTRNIIDTIENGVGSINEIRGCGGVVLNELWLQIISDVTAKPIILTENSDKAGVLGCAIIAAVGCGAFDSIGDACDKMVKVTKIIKPSQEAHEEYLKHYRNYLEIYNRLEPMMESYLRRNGDNNE